MNKGKSMIKIEVCIGSSCHLKGSRTIIELLNSFISEFKVEENVCLKGIFCMGKCQKGVNVKIDDMHFSLDKENARSFFENEVLTRINHD